jgi:hypothetical protein
LIFLFGKDAPAEDRHAILPIEGPLQCSDSDDNPVMFLIIEVTIPGLFTNKEYKFPLKRRIRLQPDAAGYHIDLDTICPVFGGSGDSMDLSEHYSASVSLDSIRADSAQVDISISWKIAKGPGSFNKRLRVPLFHTYKYSYRKGIKVQSYPHMQNNPNVNSHN